MILRSDTTLVGIDDGDGAIASTKDGAKVTFEQTVDSAANLYRTLTVNTAGITAFKGNVGNTAVNQALGALTTDAAGTTELGGGGTSITVNTSKQGAATTGDQTFNDAVVLKSDTTLNAANAGNVTFEQTVDSAVNLYQALKVNTAGITAFKGNVGNTAVNQALGALTTDAAGTTELGGGGTSITVNTSKQGAATTGDQTFNDAVVLKSDTTLNAANVTFEQTLNGKKNLTLNVTQKTTFNGIIGTSTDGLGDGSNSAILIQAGDATFNTASAFLNREILIKASEVTIEGISKSSTTITEKNPNDFPVVKILGNDVKVQNLAMRHAAGSPGNGLESIDVSNLKISNIDSSEHTGSGLKLENSEFKLNFKEMTAEN